MLPMIRWSGWARHTQYDRLLVTVSGDSNDEAWIESVAASH